MSKILTYSDLTTLKDRAIKGELALFENNTFDFTGLILKDAPEYPEIDIRNIAAFYAQFEKEPKNEFELARILHESIQINRNLAANPLYWMYIHLKYFTRFINERWLNSNEYSSTIEKGKDVIKYFLNVLPSQNSLIQSPIAGLWWSIELTVDEAKTDKYFYSKEFLLDRNLREKNLGSHRFIRNKKVLQAVLDFYISSKRMQFDDINIGTEAIAQQTSKVVNQIGGLTLLSYLDKESIMGVLNEQKELIRNRAFKVRENKRISKMNVENRQKDIFEDQEISTVDKPEEERKNSEKEDYFNADLFVQVGSKVAIVNKEGKMFFYYILKYAIRGEYTNKYRHINAQSLLASCLLGRKLRDTFEYGNMHFTIVEISSE